MSRGDDVMYAAEAEVVMGYVLEHYLKHHDVVFRKLGHARSATSQGISEVKSAPRPENDNNKDSELREMQRYEEIWDEIIAIFSESGATEDELERIEEILMRMPSMIKKYYDLRVRQDAILQALINELQSEKYISALALTRRVQSRPDLLSGLRPDEFTLPEKRRSFMMKTPLKKDSKK